MLTQTNTQSFACKSLLTAACQSLAGPAEVTHVALATCSRQNRGGNVGSFRFSFLIRRSVHWYPQHKSCQELTCVEPVARCVIDDPSSRGTGARHKVVVTVWQRLPGKTPAWHRGPLLKKTPMHRAQDADCRNREVIQCLSAWA